VADQAVVALLRLGHVALEMLGELVAPTRCAACEQLVGPRVVFCAGCAPSVLRAPESSRGELAVFAYGGAVATAIVRFKYAGRSDLAARFGALMAQRATSFAGSVDVVVPVPLHPRRVAERGFDQAALLARPVALGLRLAHVPHALARTRETPAQASLRRDERSAHVAAACRCPAPRLVEGRRVLLVDDVRTTGATLASCAEVLLAGGARSVCSLVLACRERDENVQKSAKSAD
jgi:ComF family protein